MSERRPDQGGSPANGVGVVSPSRRIGRRLRRVLSDVREAWRDPAIPAATPALRDYPIHRP